MSAAADRATCSRGPEIITFGCRLNAYESEVMHAHACDAGLTDAVIVNTCAVTAEAERQARQAIRRARRLKPDATIIVTGCAAQIDPHRFAAMPEVDRVLGNDDKLRRASFEVRAEPVRVADIMAVRETSGHLLAGFAGRARAFLQVQNGCDHRCTFCIIPFARGPSRSVPAELVIDQARRLVAQGAGEVVLSGVDIGAYGEDLPGRPALGQLVRALLDGVPELARLRLSSIDPVEIDPALFELLGGEPRLMPHLHLSLQSGDDTVLKRMKRRHGRADVLALCAALRAARPDIVFGADVIAGFPTETDAMFAATLDLIDRCRLTYLHVFPYSERPGTAAARMPQVAVPVRRARARRLREKGTQALRAHMQGRVGTIAKVLVESAGFGRTEHYAPIRLDAAPGTGFPPGGARVRACVTGVAGGELNGLILS